MWVTKLFFSPVKKGFFAHCWLIWCPVYGLAGGCGARAVSRKTPIYFIVFMGRREMSYDETTSS